MTSPRYRRDPRVAWQTIAGEAVLVNLATGDTLGLNESGGWIWSQIEERSLDELAAHFEQEFGLKPVDARKDVREFVDLLLSEHLITAEDGTD